MKDTSTAPNSKSKLLFLMNYLMEHTDEQHPVSIEDIIALYDSNGFKGNRNTVPDDIKVLQETGVDVIVDHRGKFKAYYIGNRLFELAEVRTLIDAVSNSRFITPMKSEELIAKLTKLTSEHSREYLMHTAFSVDRIKTDSIGIFLNIDTINDAIRTSRKISFQYIDYTPDKAEIRRHDGKVYVVSPQAFLWNDDRYYVPSYSEEKGCIIPFRVDRMREVAVLDEPAVIDETFNPSEYSRRVMEMYDGNVEEQDIILEAENRHMLSIIDRFGRATKTRVINKDRFMAKVTVCPSSTFFAWVFQFGGEIRIASPDSVIEEYLAFMTNTRRKQRRAKKQDKVENLFTEEEAAVADDMQALTDEEGAYDPPTLDDTLDADEAENAIFDTPPIEKN